MLIACMNALKDAIAFAQSIESKWAPDMKMPDGQFVMTYNSGEKAPDNEMLGPVIAARRPFRASSIAAASSWPNGATPTAPT